MNTRNIQTFLMVSAAFFAMSAPMRSSSAGTLANAVIRSEQIAPSRTNVEHLGQATQASEEDKNS